MSDRLQDYLKRPKRYENIDGTGEMCMGLMALGFVLVGYLQAAIPKHSMWGHGLPSMLLFYLILIAVMGLGSVLQKTIKKHITWPRTGYVAYGPDPKALRKNRSKIVLLGVVVGLVFGFIAVRLYELVEGQLGLFRLDRFVYIGFWAPVYAFWIVRMGPAHRWKWLIFLVQAVGLIVLCLKVPGGLIALSRPVMLFVGLTWLLSGAATLVSYLRHTPRPVEEEA